MGLLGIHGGPLSVLYPSKAPLDHLMCPLTTQDGLLHSRVSIDHLRCPLIPPRCPLTPFPPHSPARSMVTGMTVWQMVNMLVESSTNVTVNLKFSDTFLRLRDTVASDTFHDHVTKGV